MAKALKPMSKDEELAAVPQNEEVLVELEPLESTDEGNEPVVEPQRQRKKVEQDDADGGAAELEKQLVAAQTAEQRARERADAAEKAAEDARKERDAARLANTNTEKALVTNSLAAAQAEVAAAKASYKTAFEAGDADAMADAQEQIGRAAAKVLSFEGAVSELESGDDTQVVERKPAKDDADDRHVDIVTAIDRDPKLMSTERDWLKAHTEVLTDNKINRKLAVAYDEALDAGLRRGTPAYFQFLDEKLGYAKPAKGSDEDDHNEERPSVVAAPVSRENTSSVNGQRLTPSQIKLTPRQREMAALTGVSETEYARGLQQMNADKQANPEKYAAR